MNTQNQQTGRRTPHGTSSGLLGDVLSWISVGTAAVLSCLLIAYGFGVIGVAGGGEHTLVGVLGVLLVLTCGPIALRSRRGGLGDGVRDDLLQLRLAIKHLVDQSSLSDDARRVLNRQTERELLRRAIEEDISARAWDAAVVLCDELAERFGYRSDAEEFRKRIERARAEVFEQGVTDAIARLDGLIVQRQWDSALMEAARIRRLFPESPRVARVEQRVEHARRVYRDDLERRFLGAAKQERVEEAMELLKELDGYLTEGEAEPFREVARGVIGKARENLGAQFKLAVRDKQWASAAAIGRRIINEFPNTRMAQEVRGLMDGILTRANASGSGVGGTHAPVPEL